MMKPEIEDTYAEAFDGLLARIMITAKDEKRLIRAVTSATALPLTVLGEAEGGIDRWLNETETPDERRGAIIQVWILGGEKAVETLEIELAKRIRQGILVVPTTTVFNALDSEKKIDIMNRVGHCGDGYEEEIDYLGRRMINIPIMMGDFLIERHLGYSKGIMGGNIWYFCKTIDAALEAGDKAVDAINRIDGAITPFDICSAGSKVETNYPEIGPTTNHPFCPTLKGKIPDSLVPEGTVSIPEIVINGISLDVVKEAMRATIKNIEDVEGVLKISAGNYGGKLGKYKIYLKDIVD
ncbi:MAG: formylmethanofuran--tetrahydromethanopterin N-formyltransferase [Candidatus Hodarchaeota archaeon]